MTPAMLSLGVAIALALMYDFLDGFNGSGSIAAPAISSGAFGPRRALLFAAFGDLLGPFVFGTAVAATIGRDLVDPHLVSVEVIIAALLAAVIWIVFGNVSGVPTSSSHALIGGLVGAVLVAPGPSFLHVAGLARIVIALFSAPLLGFVLGFVAMRVVIFLARGFSPRINTVFKLAQAPGMFGLAVSHGGNDAQKTMGIITMALVASGVLEEFVVPFWVVAISAVVISLGVATGGWSIIRTLGGRFYRLRPVHGFTVETTSAAIVIGATLFGGPISMSQIVGSTIVGVGAAERVSKVRWGETGGILVAWVLTIPATIVMAAIFRLGLVALSQVS